MPPTPPVGRLKRFRAWPPAAPPPAVLAPSARRGPYTRVAPSARRLGLRGGARALRDGGRGGFGAESGEVFLGDGVDLGVAAHEEDQAAGDRERYLLDPE